MSVNYKKISDIKYLELFTFFLLFLIIGFRLRTGGDFAPYINTFDRIDRNVIPPNVEFPNFTFESINYFFSLLNFNIFGVNIFLSSIFTFFLYGFLKNFKNIYFSLVVAFPIIVMVYGIGSVRQGLALIMFLGIFNFRSESKKILSLLMGFFFHSSSIIYFFTYFTSKVLETKKYVVFIFPLFLLILFLVFDDQYYLYFKFYITQDFFNSAGFFFRNTLTLICAFIYIYLFFYRTKIINIKFRYPFLIISFLSIIVFPLGFFYSAPADRIMAYFLPLKIVLISILYENISQKYKMKINYLNSVFFGLMLWAWYYFGLNSRAWEYELFFLPIKF